MTGSQPAQALHCPACGAPVPNEQTRCQYCGAALATVVCPSCFSRMLAGAKFCSHCGAGAAEATVTAGEKRLCPRCQMDMKAVSIGSSHMYECPQCEGLWVDPDTLQRICTEQEKQAAVLGMAAPAPEPASLEKIRYIPCPVCHQLMNRVNFAQCSHVIVDVCKGHGTWFDKDKLRHLVEFIHNGGLEKSRTQQLTQLEDEKRKLQAMKTAGTILDQQQVSVDTARTGGEIVTDLLRFLLK